MTKKIFFASGGSWSSDICVPPSRSLCQNYSHYLRSVTYAIVRRYTSSTRRMAQALSVIEGGFALQLSNVSRISSSSRRSRCASGV